MGGLMLENFPHHPIPDGAVLAPHHAYLGVLLAFLAVALVWDDVAGREPWIGATALLGATFAFLLVWRIYPVTGATLSLLAVGVALASTLSPFWASYSWAGPRGLLLVGGLVALDDVAEHAFGLPTPLDWLWTHHIVQHIH